MAQALILSGGGRYADPWHPFAETSARLAGVLGAQGFDATISEDVDASLADLDGIDLLVINAGDPSRNVPESDPGSEPDAVAAARAGLLTYVGRGGPILAMHTAASSLTDIDEWETILGGRWVEGVAMHPPFGLARIAVSPERHPIVATSEDFELYDERYSYLRTAPDVVPLATHVHDGIEHPLLWARDHRGGRLVYDALGHDTRSYDSAEHREILARSARWLVGDLA